MDISAIVSVIGSVGFPIVACCAMGYFIATSFRDFNDLLTKNNILTEELITVLKNGKDGDNANKGEDNANKGEDNANAA